MSDIERWECPVHGADTGMTFTERGVSYCGACHRRHAARLELVRYVPASQLEGAVEEARAALRWITSNADVPADDRHQATRLRQIKARADEALTDLLRPVPPGYKVCAYCSQIVPQAAHGMSCSPREEER
jgi:hypothetical protein